MGGGIKKSVSHLLASPRVRPRRAAPWKAIATPPPPPKPPRKTGISGKTKNRQFPYTTVGRGARTPKYPNTGETAPKIYLAVSLAVLHGGARFGALLEGFLGGKSPISVPTAAREEARAPPPPRVLWGALGVFGDLGVFPAARRPRRKMGSESGILGSRSCPQHKTGSESGILGPACFPGAKRAQKVGFWVRLTPPAQNRLGKWGLGLSALPRGKMGSESGVLGQPRVPGAK